MTNGARNDSDDAWKPQGKRQRSSCHQDHSTRKRIVLQQWPNLLHASLPNQSEGHAYFRPKVGPIKLESINKIVSVACEIAPDVLGGTSRMTFELIPHVLVLPHLFSFVPGGWSIRVI